MSSVKRGQGGFSQNVHPLSFEKLVQQFFRRDDGVGHRLTVGSHTYGNMAFFFKETGMISRSLVHHVRGLTHTWL